MGAKLGFGTFGLFRYLGNGWLNTTPPQQTVTQGDMLTVATWLTTLTAPVSH